MEGITVIAYARKRRVKGYCKHRLSDLVVIISFHRTICQGSPGSYILPAKSIPAYSIPADHGRGGGDYVDYLRY